MAKRPEEEEMDEMDGAEDQQEEVVVQGKQSWLANAPWWLISVGIHAVLILGATLVAIERLVAIDEGEVAVVVTAKSAPVVAEIERPRDVFERKGIPKDDQVAQPTDEPAIFFPEAKESDHNESADNEDYHQMKGDSKDFLSYIKGEAGGFRGRQAGKNPGVYDTMGVGVGGGGGGESFMNQCIGGRCGGPGERDYDTGVTATSLLAFLGAGYSQMSKDEYPDPANPGRMLKFG